MSGQVDRQKINWKEAIKEVRSIQEKIVTATLAEDMKKVYDLQRKLKVTHDKEIKTKSENKPKS